VTTDPEPQHDALDLDAVREAFESSTDFTIGIEEEFAILDPAILDLEHRFEEMQAACLRDELLAPAVKGELIDTEIEIRSGRGETFAEAADQQRARRARLFGIAEEMGLTLAAMGTHPWANYLDQHIIDTEHYRQLEADLRWVAQRNNTWSLHVHVGVRGADRAVAVCDRLRPVLPILLAISANSPYLDQQDSGLHSARSEIFTRTFPRCGVPEPFGSWAAYADYLDLLDRTRSIVEFTQVWWSIRPHIGFGTVEVRICDAQSTAAESEGLAGLIVACVAQAARDEDEGVPLADRPGRLIEENMWRAIRWGQDGDLIDLDRAETYPAAEAAAHLAEWTAPARAELGLEIALPELNGAQRQRRLIDAGATPAEVYAAAVKETLATYPAEEPVP
jgi:glutamate---cysteine ligase / carboxylate-amine ligase